MIKKKGKQLIDAAKLKAKDKINTAKEKYNERQAFLKEKRNSKNVELPEPKKKNGGGCSGDCTPPTFGKNKHGIMIVQGGFSLNGNTVDVDSYHTEYPLIELDIGTQYNIKLKSYENYNANNFKWFQIGFGMPEVGSPLNDAEVLLTIHMNHTGIESTEVRENNNLIEFTDFTTSVENCGYIISDCRVISVDFIPRETLYNNVLTIQAVDRSRNSGVNHLNDGIEFTGESLNLPQTDKMWTKHSNQNRGIWLQLTEVNKFTNTWEDENGIQYHKYNGAYSRTTPMPDYECKDKPLHEINVPTRSNCHFRALTTIWDL